MIISSPLLPVLGSCLARPSRSPLGYILKASSSVRDFTRILAYQVKLFHRDGLGIYTGIFVLYLNYAWKKSRAAVILYALCLLYVLSAITLAADVTRLVYSVSNDTSICQNIIFYQSC